MDPTDRLSALLDEAEGRLVQTKVAEDAGRPTGDGSDFDEADAETLPLMTGQERLWYLEQIDEQPETFIRPVAMRIEGRLDEGALRASLAALVDRHELLRSEYVTRAGRPQLRVQTGSEVDLELEIVDADRVDVEMLRTALSEPSMHVDSSRAPMMRARLYKLRADEGVLLLTIHHTIVDAWSAEVIRSDLASLYADVSANRPIGLEPLDIQPTDLATRQRRAIGEGHFQAGVERVAARVRSHDEGLEFPPDKRRSATRSHRGEVVIIRIGQDVVEDLTLLARSHGATLYMLLLSAYAVLIWRWTGRRDFAVATPTSGRREPSSEAMVGFLINRLVIDVAIPADGTFLDLLARVRHQSLEALSTADVPFDLVLEKLAPRGEVHRSPLVQTAFNLEAVPTRPSTPGPVAFRRLEVPHHVAPFDLSVEARPIADGLEFSFIYNADLLSNWSVRQMAEQYENVLREILENPELPVDRIPLLSESRREQVLSEWSDGGPLDAEDVSIVELFERMVDRYPDATALICRNEAVSYRQLDESANRLARHLVENGASEADRIAVKLDRSIEMVAALLAVMKTGAIYVPLDLIYPPQRQQELVEQTACAQVITTSKLASDVDFGGRRCVLLDEERAAVDARSPRRLGLRVDPANVAYIVHTSGSTGKPKGVPSSHRAVVRFLQAVGTAEPDGPSRRHLWISSPGFDLTNHQLYGAILFGGRAVISWEEQPTPMEIGRTIVQHGVTTARMTASFFNLLIEEVPDSLKGLKYLTTGGEPMSVEHVRRAVELIPACRIGNWYGPTETISSATEFELKAPPADTVVSISIGRPQPGRTLYILDSNQEPSAPGIPGDIYIGGSIMAEGYLDNPEATARAFLPDPFSSSTGAVMYRTGDIGRWKEDGNVEFLGRGDRQVQVRGFRIEPGEVEAAIMEIPGVKDVAVVPVDLPKAGISLAAFVLPAPGAELHHEDCRRHVGERIPPHLVPPVWSFVDHLPVTSAGKTDYGRLSKDAEALSPDTGSSRRPQTPTERRLAAIWSEVLGITEPGAEDDFFQSGGHSLLAARLYVAIEREFEISIPIATLFSAPTIASLAELLDEERESARWPTLVPIRTDGRRPAFFLVAQGNIVGFENVANKLDDRAFYVFHHPAVHREPLLEISIEDMAEHFLRELRRVQPSGPYLLGGWCAGSAVAFEMARRLVKEGDSVPLLAILDSIRPPGVTGPDGRIIDPLLDEKGGDRRPNPPALPLRLFRRYRRMTRRLMMDEHRRKTRRIRTAMVRARSHYRPSHYDGPITLLKAVPQTEYVALLQSLWSEVTTGDFTKIELECFHPEVWRPPHADQTARHLSRAIAEALGE